jgi:hypothetical protein
VGGRKASKSELGCDTGFVEWMRGEGKTSRRAKGAQILATLFVLETRLC